MPKPPQQPLRYHLMDVLGQVLAVYETKTSKHVEAKGCSSVWPQAVAEALVLNRMMSHDAAVEGSVPVFAGELNRHLIVHYFDQKTLHVAKSSTAEDGKGSAVGCMRKLLSNGLGAPDAALADKPGPSSAGGGTYHGGNNEQRPPGSASQPPSGRQDRPGMQTRSSKRAVGPGHTQ
ncbi:g6016 [Coccomyxa elongata]